MPDVTLPADFSAIVSNLMQRIERLERQTVGSGGGLQSQLASLFSYPGTLVVNTESPRWYPEMRVSISQTRVSLLAAASGNVTVAVRKNGSTIFSVTLTAGGTTITDQTPFTLMPSDYLTVEVTAIGTNGANLSVGFVPSIQQLGS